MYRIWKWLACIALLGATVLVPAATAFAQKQAPEEPQKDFVLAYVLVGFVVALAMMLVCRSGGRADRPKMVAEDLKHKMEQLTGK